MKRIGNYFGFNLTLCLFLLSLSFISFTQSAEAKPLIQSRPDQPERKAFSRALKTVQQRIQEVKNEADRIAGGTLAVKKNEVVDITRDLENLARALNAGVIVLKQIQAKPKDTSQLPQVSEKKSCCTIL